MPAAEIMGKFCALAVFEYSLIIPVIVVFHCEKKITV
jgi:hypothetical protein